MTIVVVEDDEYKHQRVLAALSKVAGLEMGNVRTARNLFEAARLTREVKPDVLILDIALPFTEDGEVEELAGLDFLREVLAHPSEYGAVSHVIGLTAYREVYENAVQQFSASMLTIALYRPDSSGWEDSLIARLKHLLAAEKIVPAYEFDVAIICALEDPELAAVLGLPWDWHQTSFAGDHTPYYEGAFVTGSGPRRVAAAASARKGMPAASCLAAKLVWHYRPRYLVMLGITAGVRGRVELGDVIVASPCWDWGSGKWIREGDGLEFKPAPFQVQLQPRMREAMRELSRDSAFLAAIRTEWSGGPPSTWLSARIGPVASGAAVLADGEILKLVQEQHREILGVEMEAYSLFVVAEEIQDPKPIPLVVKSAVDFGDGNKDDRYQAYGAYTSARFFAGFAQRYL